MPLINIKKLNSTARVPKYAKEGDTAFDLFPPNDAGEIVVLPNCVKEIPLGFATEIEPGFGISIRPRSGWARKFHITIQNSPATVDNGYRGEWIILLRNEGTEIFKLPYKDGLHTAIAQGVVEKIYVGYFNETQELSNSERGAGGFGHTSK